MITSEQQYKVALQKLEMLRISLKSPAKQEIPAVIEKAGRSQIFELIEKLQSEVTEFERYKDLDVSEIEIHSLDDLIQFPIRYRLAAGMSIDKFARFVGISARQISRYEKESYKNTHTSTLNSILNKLHVDIEGRVGGG